MSVFGILGCRFDADTYVPKLWLRNEDEDRQLLPAAILPLTTSHGWLIAAYQQVFLLTF